MDDAQWDRLQAKRERTAHFNGLERDAKAAKERWQQGMRDQRRQARRNAARKERPTTTQRDAEAPRDRRILREHAWAVRRAQKAAQKALTGVLREARRTARRNAAARAQREAWEARKAARQAATPTRSRSRYTPKPRQEWGKRTGRPSMRPDNCEGCGRPTRPRASRSVDWPGCIRYAGFGLCDSCSRGQDPARRNDLIHDGSTNCGECGWTLRPRNRSLGECPGTRTAGVVAVGGGYVCKTCHTRARRNALVA